MKMASEKDEFSEIRIRLPGRKDKVFMGKELAYVSTRWIAGREQTRWDAYTLYKTASGKFVLKEEYISLWQGEESTLNVKVFDTEAEMLEYLTQDSLGIDLLKKAGYDISERIE